MKRNERDTKRIAQDKGRRAFLRNAVATGIAAGVASASADAVAGFTPEAQVEDNERGYRLTEHVKAYYESFNR